MSERVGLLIEDVPTAVMDAVKRDAAEHDMSRNDVVCEILATRFRVPWSPTGYSSKWEGTDEWNLRLTPELQKAISRYAKENSSPGRRITQRGVVITTLQLHYDLPVSSPRRRPSRPPLDPDLVREARARKEAGESIRSLSRRYGIKRETIAKAISE
jgi:hypothetical protein